MATTRRAFLKTSACLTGATAGTLTTRFSFGEEQQQGAEMDPASPNFPNRPQETRQG